MDLTGPLPTCWVPGVLLGHHSFLLSPSEGLRTLVLREKGRPDDVPPPPGLYVP